MNLFFDGVGALFEDKHGDACGQACWSLLWLLVYLVGTAVLPCVVSAPLICCIVSFSSLEGGRARPLKTGSRGVMACGAARP